MTNTIDHKFPMGIQEIQACIPHRYPFLLIDKVLTAKPGKHLVAIKNVSMSDDILQGHFPGNPIVPGVLIVEGMAQAAAVLGHLTKEGGLSTALLTEIRKARFRHQVVPGDTMRYEIAVSKMRPPFFWFEAACFVEDKLVAQVSLTALMK